MLAFPLFALAATSVIIDTDVGSDDLMAIAFLLSRPDVRIEALTVANGLAHPQTGARNLLRLLTLAGRPEIPVYIGSGTPLRVTAPFPDEWRKKSDELPGVDLRSAKREPQKGPAAEFLAHRLRAGRATVLALGPLTNLAQAFEREPTAVGNLERLVIMGGAFHVPGNLGDGGAFKTDNKTAEWNIFVDPLAAGIVFRSAPNIEVIPLDATSKVPIDLDYLKNFKASTSTALGRFVAQVLEVERPFISAGFYQAWDPLAAVSLIEPKVGLWRPTRVQVGDDGQTVEAPGSHNARVALGADDHLFHKLFRDAFQ
jgi:inosine-uridine nucleoside N-ribohydrolase